MYNLILENAAGDQLKFGMGTPFSIVEIQGLNPPAATVNTNQLALMDGAKYNSAKVEMRTIDIAFAIELDPPKNRIEVYKVLKSKQYVKVIYDGKYRHVYAEGYVTAIQITYFDMKQIVTCSILCPDPYFKAMQESVTEVSTKINAFSFPFASQSTPELVFGYYEDTQTVSVENDGDVSTGLIFELSASGYIRLPTIYDYETNDLIQLDYSMQAGDVITIDTNAGHKTVTLLRGGVESNIFNSVTKDSSWLQLPANGGTYVYNALFGNVSDLKVTIRHTDLYEGV